MIAIACEMKVYLNLARSLSPTKQQRVWSVFALHVELKAAIEHFGEHPEEADEVTLACAVRSDEHIQLWRKRKVVQLANGLEPSHAEACQSSHGLNLSPRCSSICCEFSKNN